MGGSLDVEGGRVIALDLGELTIALQLDNDRFRQQLANTKRELEGIPPVAQREVRKISRTFDDEGRKSGGTLAKGINAGLIRNSPLIAAAVAGALAAGAPIALAGAGVLFGGIAAVAASQSLDVRNSWMEMGQDIRAGMVADAAVLIPTFTRMADEIGAAFQRLRPQIQDAFADSEPLVDSFTDGIIALAENAMPGFVRAIAAGRPVFEGFESFLASTGTGLTRFFDGMSSHSPAAGAAFASLGDILGDLLPILGELLGQGAELAADVLPAVANATGLTLDVLQALGPLLPPIVAGFVAFKAAQLASGYLSTFAGQIGIAASDMGKFGWQGELAGAGVRKVGGAVATLGKALPAVGIAFGLASAQIAASEQRVNDFTEAILKGGHAAQVAAQQAREASTGWNEFTDSMQFGEHESVGEMLFGADDEEKFAEAQQAAQDLLDAMTPLELAEHNVAKATGLLSEKLDEFGPGSNEAAGAARALESAQGELERRNGDLELAIHGVTSAMIAQAEQALGLANADYAYRSSLEGIDDQLQAIADAQFRQGEAGAALAEAQRVHGAGSAEAAAAQRDLQAATEGVSDAQFELEGTLLRAADAAGRLAADALPATATELQRQQAAAAGSLTELERLKTEMGANFPPALQQAIDRLKQSGVALTNTGLGASETASRIRDLGLSVNEVPGQKFVRVEAPTAPQIQGLKDLGYHVVTLPNGDIYVATNAADAAAAIDYAARPRVATVRVVTQGGVHITGPGGGGTILRAGGGPVFGGGTETSDSIPARLSHNEHVWTAREVRAAGGHGAIEAMRKAVLSGRGYATGGAVGPAGGAPATPLSRSTHITVEARTYDARRIAKAIADEQRDREFLAGVS